MLEHEGRPARVSDAQKDWSKFQPPWGPIGEQVFLRSYSLTLNAQEIYDVRKKNRKFPLEEQLKVPDPIKETFFQTVTRAVGGNLGLVDSRHHEPDEEEKLMELLMTMAGLPGGRHLNSSGLPGRQFLFSCHAAGWDPVRTWLHFSFLF